MALSTIITRLTNALETVSGVATVKLPASEKPLTGDELPAIVCEGIPLRIDALPQQSVWQYPLTLHYLHSERSHDTEPQFAAVLDTPKLVVDKLNSNATLAGAVYGVRFEDDSGGIGIIDWRDKTYVGFTLNLLLKEKYAVSYTG